MLLASAAASLTCAKVLAFCAVVTKHGDIPKREPGQIYVANHSTVLDIVGMLSSGSVLDHVLLMLTEIQSSLDSSSMD